MPNAKSNSHGRVAPVSQIALALSLDKRAAQLFDVLLDLGSVTVQRLAQMAKTERTGTYDVLKRLVDRGFVESRELGTRREVQVVSPDAIRARYAESLEQVDRLMPELRARYAVHTTGPQVTAMRGAQAFQAVFEAALTSPGPMVRLRVPITDVMDHAQDVGLVRLVQLTKPVILVLLPSAVIAPRWQWLERYAKRLELRVLKHRAVLTTGSLAFHSQLSYITEANDELLVTTINSADIALAHEALFDTAWYAARPVSAIPRE